LGWRAAGLVRLRGGMGKEVPKGPIPRARPGPAANERHSRLGDAVIDGGALVEAHGAGRA